MASKKKKDDKPVDFNQMKKEIAAAPVRNLTGSLEQCKEELNHAYMNFRELNERCVIKIDTVNKTDKPVFYFKPDSFLMDDPDRQRYFRESLLKKISAMPKPEPITYLGDEMHRGFLSVVADQSRPTICKKNLAMFFKKRQYALQHLKYKLLCRWAHLSMNCHQMETGKDAVFLFGKIEYSIEQAMNRAERLAQEDYYDMAIPANRPNTRAEHGQGSLYVENVDLEPQSLIREDDIMIYSRSCSYRNKVSKAVNKFMSRLKWLPMMHRFEIYEKAIESKNAQKEANIKAQLDFIERIDARARNMNIVTSEVEQELQQILNSHYVRMYILMYSSQAEKIANSWRSDHDNVPNLINNQHELKIRIIDSANEFGITGNIEIDHGYGFSYQVTVKFPVYFQRQCIKSQFSIYDIFATDKDKNQVQKHMLANMTRIDTNIIRDISTTPQLVPDDESLAFELRNENIKVIRLKSCAYWIDYVCMTPIEPEWHRKQQAILNNNNPVDSLTRSSMNFLDVSDLASVNRINEDNALLHQQAVRRIQAHNPHDMIIQKTHNSANEGEKKFAINLQEHMNSTQEAAQMDKHLMDAIQGGGMSDQMGLGRNLEAMRNANAKDASSAQQQSMPNNSRSGLRTLPQHLLVSFFTLRYMKSRDNKTKILYALNFCRAIQKRLSLDLREFGTRERVDSHLQQPYVHSSDADKKVTTNVNLISSTIEARNKDTGPTIKGMKPRQNSEQIREANQKYEKMAVFDPDVINNMKNMASVRMFKVNGTFNNKVFSTCPSVPKFHCTFGEPTMKQTQEMEDATEQNQDGISKSSLKLMGRIDHIELDESLEEVYVKDDFGVYILYDCVLQDMKGLEEELIKICSYFVNKAEVLQDIHTEKPSPSKDRLQSLNDLLDCEATFHFKKVKLTMAYMECYEHIVDPLEQQRLMQVITDTMSRRPRLNLQANYFADSYKAEFECLDNQLELVKLLIKNQIGLEKKQNRMLQDSLALSYTLCNQYEENRWKYQDAEELLQAVLLREKHEKAGKRYAKVMTNHKKRSKRSSKATAVTGVDQQMVVAEEDDEEDEECSATENGSQMQKRGKSRGSRNAEDEGETKDGEDDEDDEDLGEASINSDMTEMDLINGQDNVFQQLLGLPEISIETLYMASKEKDKTIVHLMNEHTNFIQIHDGYPEFLNFQQGGSNGKIMRNFKVNSWSEPTANLDFYDSLGFINKFSAIMTQIQQELYDALKPYDPTVMTYIDSHIARFAMQEFRQVLKYMEGAEVEYEGRQYVEDESVMGDTDKMTFYAKDMISQLQLGLKTQLDPYLMAKQSVATINYFDFPRMPKTQSKYLNQFQDGVKPSDWVIKMHKQVLADTAKRKSKPDNMSAPEATVAQNIGLDLSGRRIEVPSLLTIFCNMVELMRLRHEIILTASECCALQQIYLKQAEACRLPSLSCFLKDSISFEQVDIQDDQAEMINYFDEGPSHLINIGLAVYEFDPCLLSNFNFRNPDSFKLNITTAGLEEVRAVLMYQLLQKHLLIVATRLNQLIIDNSLKALSEINMLQTLSIATPNSTFDINSVFSRNADNLSTSHVKEVRQKFSANLSKSVQQCFYSITERKRQMRTDIAKEYSNYISKVSRVHPAKNQCIQRVMRAFKVKQLIRYCETIMLEAHLDAQKVQAVQVCQRLRTFSTYFSFDPANFNMTVIQKGKPGEPRKEDYQVFEYETNSMIENFSYPYMPKEEEENALDDTEQAKEVKAINPNNMTMIDIGAIPSSSSLILCEASAPEEIKTYKDKLTEIHKNYNAGYQEDLKLYDEATNNPEQQTKEMLPAMTLRDMDPSYGKGRPEDSDIDKLGYPALDYEEALNFGQSRYAKLIRYYQYIERILNLEWFICKLQFRQDTVVHMDNALNLGLPFWQDTEYERRMKKEIVNRPIKDGLNPISQNFVHSNIVSRQTKKNIAEEISSMSLTMQNLMRRYSLTKDELKYEFLNSYTEFRYMQILGSFHKIIQQFYIQKRSGNGIRSMREAISQLTKMDHVHISYSRGNSYHVNTSLVHPHMQLLESTNLIMGAHSEDEHQNFIRCIQPVINEKALEPPQLTLFQSLYQTDNFRKRLPTQFAGQLVSSHNAWSFKALDSALLEMTMQDRTYAQSFIMQAKDQANDFMEIVIDPSLATMSNDEVYNLQQLQDAKKFLAETTQALLLKFALICWNENQILPDNAEVYAKFEENFRNMFFWKIVEQKENMVANLSLRGDPGIPSKKHLNELRQKIDDLMANYSLATATEEEHRAAMVKQLRIEFRAQKKKVTLDSHFSTKAEILVLSNEIEKLITRAAVQTLDAEHTALSRCFTLSQPKIQMRIHPFQQFAATLYDKVDVQQHLDLTVKLGFVQELLTKMRNRGTEVGTLTSGPGVVFVINDFNDALTIFCRKLIIYGEQELKSRSDLFAQKEEHLMHLLYLKDQKISDLERRIQNSAKNIENIISAKLFEKGNQLIYQLDSSSRLLILFKQTMFGLETEIKNKILGDQAQKFKLSKDALDTQIEALNDYKQAINQMVNEEFIGEYHKSMEWLKKQVEKAHDIDPETSNYVPPTLYPATGGPRYRNPIQQVVIRHANAEDDGPGVGRGGGGLGGGPGHMTGSGGGRDGYTGGVPGSNPSELVIKDLALETVGTMPGSVVPPGFQHYTHCSCFVPSKQYPNYTMDLAELEMMSEREARYELARVCEVMRKQRLFWRTKEMLTKQKFQNKINLMKKQLSNNAYLWDQMAESEKRETILKQELLFTQQSLSAAEKVIEKLQEEMKKVEADRQRLYKYKHSKAERLKELEDKIKKFEVYENIDTDKLITVLGKKDEECKQLQSIATNFTQQVQAKEQRKANEVNSIKNKLVQEQVKTQQVVEKMEQMKLELKMLESNDTSVASIWKKKCLDLFEVCQALKVENEELRERCKDLITQGIQLADAVNQENDHQNQILSQQPARLPVYTSSSSGQQISSFPRLKPQQPSHSSQQRINTKQAQAPATAGHLSGRHGSSTANTYEQSSNLGGYPIVDSRLQNGVKSAQSNIYEELQPNNDALLLSSQFQIPSHVAGGVSKSKQFAATMNTAVNGKFRSGGAQQLQPIAVGGGATGTAKQALRQQIVQQQLRKSGLPQTQHAGQRGKTIGGVGVAASGPTYYMPGQQANNVTGTGRAGQYTRQKPTRQQSHQMRSILGSSGKPQAQDRESSFNQSFHVSTDKAFSQIGSPLHAPQTQFFSPRVVGPQPSTLRGQGQTPQAFVKSPERQDDSLFESSMVSMTHQHNKNGRRQFMMASGGRQGQSGTQQVGQMQAAAIFGSKLKHSGGAAERAPAANTATNPSTKPGSQFTEEATKTATSNLGMISSKQAAEDAKEEIHLNNYVSDEVQKNIAQAAALVNNGNSLIQENQSEETI